MAGRRFYNWCITAEENAGADWARPMALQELMDYEPAKKKVEEYVKSRVSSNI